MIVSTAAVLGVAAISLGLVLTPGPNMLYLTSRSINQGRRAGLVSLTGVAAGFGCYLLASALGLAAIFGAVPTAFVVVKIAGAAYLGYLAWQLLRPDGKTPFARQELQPDSDRRLFLSGLTTNLLNPKIAMLYAALLPQFVVTGRGPIWQQTLLLGAVQIAVAVTVNGLIVIAASTLSRFLHRRPKVLQLQRRLSGAVLAFFAIKVALSHRPG
jgi:threonine/homoserine/homoserine lactone efflux protein